ncbi:MAG: methyltransferase domain-containing protein [Acidobacteriota bacterium]|jgi:2-polyprenyl-3-methyl-5-hydroxy-6-metoxy-1,4-benzoquinol methylase
MKTTCTLCGGSSRRTIFVEFHIPIYKCRDCGHVYSSHEVSQDYDGYFGDEAGEGDHFWQGSAHDSMYGAFGRRYLENRRGRLLDVGAGLGFFVRFACRYEGWEVHGYEISPAGVKYAREELGLDHVHQGRVEDSAFPERHFDVITLFDVIEHLPDPRPMLCYLRSVLKDDGLLFLHTPNIQAQLPKVRIKKALKGMKPGMHFLEAQDHMNIYSPKTLRRILNECGFTRVVYRHLPPIQGVAGSGNPILRQAKNLWFNGSVALSALTFGRLNLDNLFAEARP